MLSSLPPELLHQIIESTVPHTFHSTTYDDRQRTLSSLSLVSKCFRAIAQPLLYEIVWIPALKTIQRFESAREGAGTDGRASLGRNRVKEVAIGDSMLDGVAPLDIDADEVCKFLSTLSSLESLSWKSNERGFLNSSHLLGLKHLSNLHLSFHEYSPDAIDLHLFGNLQSLTLYCEDLAILKALLDPAVVPNLKHFALVTFEAQAAENLNASRFDHLVPQLRTLSFDFELWHKLDSNLRSAFKTRTLIDCHIGNLEYIIRDENQVVNARMCSEAQCEGIRDWGHRLEASLDQFAASLEQTQTLSLQSLYLDTSLRPSDSLSPKLLEAITKIIRITQDRQIDLVFETVPNDFTVDPCISPEFRRKQRARVEKETQKSD